MTPSELDDPILERVRAARPAPPAGADHVPARAHEQLSEILSAPRGRDRRRTLLRRRMAGALVPSLGVAVAVAVMVIVLTAHTGRSPSTSPATGASRPLTAHEYAVALGFGTVVPGLGSDAATRLLFDAEQQLRARCMSARGLTYKVERAPADGRLPSFTGYPTTFYPNPSPGPYPEAALLAARERDGFGLYVEATAPRTDPDPEDHYVASLPAPVRTRWESAWTGPRGCLSETAKELYGSREQATIAGSLPTLVYNSLNGAAYTRSGSLSPNDRATAKAAARWSSCVHAQTGEVFADEDGLVAWLSNGTRPAQQRTERFRRREIRYALISTTCAYSSGQAQAFAAAFRAAANHLPANVLRDLRFVLTHQARWLANARKVIAG